LVLKAPDFETSSEIVSVDVSGKGVGGQKDFEVTTLFLELLFPDMKFDDKMLLSGGSRSRNAVARVGEMVTIQVKVHNTGDIPAEDVDIRLYIDGVEKSTRTLKVLKNDSDDIKSVVFTWVAEAGEHQLKVIIDPDNDIIEVQGGEGDDNVLTRTVRVRGSSIVNDVIGDDPIVNVVLILIFAMVIIVGIALLMKKRHMI
jgi:subtilase family serine protease